MQGEERIVGEKPPRCGEIVVAVGFIVKGRVDLNNL